MGVALDSNLHSLKTYPDFGHMFSPSSQWLTAYGPMEQSSGRSFWLAFRPGQRH